jgi:hypothetical protein
MGIAGWIRLGADSGTVDDVEAQPVLCREAALIDQPSAGHPHLNATAVAPRPGCVLGDGDVGLVWRSGGIVDAMQAIRLQPWLKWRTSSLA